MQLTATPAPSTATAPATDLPQYRAEGDTMGYVRRSMPFAKEVELRFGKVLGQFDQLYDAQQSALALSEGAKPAVAISSFANPEPGFVEQEHFVLYDVDYALKTRPWNPMEDPVVVEEGDFHGDMVAKRGYGSKDESWRLGAAQYIVDNGRVDNVQTLDDRA